MVISVYQNTTATTIQYNTCGMVAVNSLSCSSGRSLFLACNVLFLFFLFHFLLQSNLIDSESSSLSALNTSEDDFEDNPMDHSFASSQLNQSLHQGG